MQMNLKKLHRNTQKQKMYLNILFHHLQLTVSGHSHRNALLEATFLTLVPGHFVDDAFPLVLAGVGWVEILLNCPPEESLESRGHMTLMSPADIINKQAKYSPPCFSWRYLATFTCDAAIVIACGFVPAHYT